MVQRKFNLKNLQLKQIISPLADVRKEPKFNSELETQCLFGENVKILKEHSEWIYCKCELDNYYGWINKKNIGQCKRNSHKIKSILTKVYEKPDIKSYVINNLYFNSKILAEKNLPDWIGVKVNQQIGYIKKIHLQSIDNIDNNWIDIAKSFMGAPYQWGGKSFIGIDCSGLVQLTLENSGIKVPRNTNDQLNFETKNFVTNSKIEKGCLIFWRGHVAIALQHNLILHSNAYHMSVEMESLKNAKDRIKKAYGNILGVKKVLL